MAGAGGGIDGLGLAAVGAGSVFLFAALKNKTVLGTLQSVIKGQSPSTATAAPGVGTGTPTPPVSGYTAPVTSNGQQALQQAAANYGWSSGAQWQALQSVEMAEAGFNPQATNPASGAYGLAQALGHGNGASTQGTVTNQYGGFGLSDAQAQAANSGDAGAQALWMCGYIAATYGTPEAAWAHEQANHWY